MAQNVLITGGNSGIGLEMARAHAARGDHVIIASRDEAKSAAAAADIKAAQPGVRIENLGLDLGNFAAIDAFAVQALKQMPVIDVLVLNAGIYAMPLRKLANGYESMMGVMHFGHFRLTQKLLPSVKAATQGRIVVTSSMMHKLGKIDEASFTDPAKHGSSMLAGTGAYGQAKLANLLFTRELARQLGGTRVTVNAFHPGAVSTGIYREAPSLMSRVMTKFMLSPKQGADTGFWLATSPALVNVSGEYFIKRKRHDGSAASRDAALAQRLWALSEAAMPGA